MKREQKDRERLVKLVELVLFPIGMLILLLSYKPLGGWLFASNPKYFLTWSGVYAEPVFLGFYAILLILLAVLFVNSLRYFIGKGCRGAG